MMNDLKDRFHKIIRTKATEQLTKNKCFRID